MRELLFLYGTLRRGSGHPNAERIAGESEWMGVAHAAGALYRRGWYPVFVPGPGGRVTGDLVRLKKPAISLAWLDAYEGPEYARRPVRVRAAGHAHEALAYIGRPRPGEPRIASGDWLSESGR